MSMMKNWNKKDEDFPSNIRDKLVYISLGEFQDILNEGVLLMCLEQLEVKNWSGYKEAIKEADKCKYNIPDMIMHSGINNDFREETWWNT